MANQLARIASILLSYFTWIRNYRNDPVLLTLMDEGKNSSGRGIDEIIDRDWAGTGESHPWRSGNCSQK
jgi:hypothetical protein